MKNRRAKNGFWWLYWLYIILSFGIYKYCYVTVDVKYDCLLHKLKLQNTLVVVLWLHNLQIRDQRGVILN